MWTIQSRDLNPAGGQVINDPCMGEFVVIPFAVTTEHPKS
jgi:hypothetical protein